MSRQLRAYLLPILMVGLLSFSTTLLTSCGDGDGDVNVEVDKKGEADKGGEAEATNDESDDDAVTIESMTLATDNNGDAGSEVSSIKSTDQIFHTVVQLSEMGPGVTVKGELVAVETSEGNNINVASVDKEVNGINNQVDFNFSLPRPWPVGKYRVNAYIDGNLAKSLDFEITE